MSSICSWRVLVLVLGVEALPRTGLGTHICQTRPRCGDQETILSLTLVNSRSISNQAENNHPPRE